MDYDWKSQKNKKDLLSQLAGVRGVYVPSFFKTHYGPEGLIDAIEPLVSGYSIIEKAVVPDIDAYPFPDCQVVPFTESIHDRLAIELFRGCTRGCRFCQAGMIYRPVRERAPESVLDKAERGLRLTGYEDLTLLSLSSGDYSCIEPLLKALMNRHSREHISISLPSLTIDSLSVFLMDQIKRVRKTGFTLAPEAGSDRLRRIINKGLTQKDIIETSRAVYGSGWNLIKLYFMIGLPWEEEEDLHDIISLAKEILSLSGKRGNRNRLNVSVSTFVPKSHTPFMWCSQIPLEESKRRIQLIRDGLKGGPVRVKWNQSELSWLEGVFSRGDRRLSRVVFEAWKLGARFDGWGERFKMEIWEEAFRRAVVDPCFYLHRERTLDEVMPWDHIRSGVTKAFHKSEWKKAQNRELSPDCRGECLGCGVCDNKGIAPVLYKQSDFTPILDKPPLKQTIASSKKYRLTFTKLKDARFLGHLELLRVFIMAFKRAELDLVYSKGFHPKPKISFACALPVGTESVQETVNIELAEASNLFSLSTRINRQLPPGIIVTSVKDISFDKKGGKVKESRFLIAVRGFEMKREALERFFETDYFPVVKISKKGEYEINARSLVKSMSFIPPGMIKLTVRHTSGPEL